MRLRLGSALFATAFAAAIAPAGAAAETIGGIHQVRAAIPLRIDRQIGFLPTNGMNRLPAFRVYVGEGQYIRGPWANFTVTRKSLSEELGFMRRGAGNGHAVFSDRRLTRSERRRFVELADLGRDADVLVVRRDHPACAGLTIAQARSIASGRTTNWSQVAAPASGAADRIAVRHVDIGDGLVEPRFGTGIRPRAGKPSSDGGIAEAANDGAVAGVTSWSRARFRSGVCTVPLNGVAPTNVSVHGLAYPGAYPIGLVAPRKIARSRYVGKLLRLFVKFLKSEQASKHFRGTGMLLKADTPDAPPQSGPQGTSGGPSQDYQGRPIAPVRDDAAATSALTGERLEHQGAGERWAFEPDGVFRRMRSSDGPCAETTGGWTVREGWRYEENGGGVIARVTLYLEAPTDVTIELPADQPDGAFVDGQHYSRSRSLPGTC